MPLSTILVFTVVLGMFSTFIVTVGGVSTWIAYCDWRERTARAPRRASERSAPPTGAALAA